MYFAINNAVTKCHVVTGPSPHRIEGLARAENTEKYSENIFSTRNGIFVLNGAWICTIDIEISTPYWTDPGHECLI